MDNELELLREELQRREEEHKIELALTRNRVRNIKAAMAILQPDKITIGEDGMRDIDGYIEQFRNENGWLFESDSWILSTARPHGRAESRSYDKMSDEEFYRTVAGEEF